MVAVPAVPTFAAGQKLTAATLTTHAQATTFAVARPCAIATRSTAQSIPNTTKTSISFDTEAYDNDGLFAATSTTITITRAGVWEIEAFTSFDSNVTGTRWSSVYVNAVLVRQCSWLAATGGNPTDTFVYLKRLLAVGDAITSQAFQSSGGALNAGTADGLNTLSVFFCAG